MAKPPNGYELWRGASLLDDRAIVVLATGFARRGSLNIKTGPMIQTWILLQDHHPGEASRDGNDKSICGDCPLRSDSAGSNRGCYVNTWWAPSNIWTAWRKGNYPVVHGSAARRELGKARRIRIGAYGDPAAVPFELWGALLGEARNWTAYTHQWSTCDQRFRHIAMASVESAVQAERAHAAGWRTFRTLTDTGAIRSSKGGDREILCPASAEGGFRSTCDKCGLCNGRRPDDVRAHIAIVVHGMGKRAAKEVVGFGETVAPLVEVAR